MKILLLSSLLDLFQMVGLLFLLVILPGLMSLYLLLLLQSQVFYLFHSSYHSIGTQYFRKTFTGVSGLAAYELEMKYQYGIIAYMNGAEIYRDNMPEGSVTSTTAALGGYSSLQYHGVIRNGLEVTSGQQIVAIELHYTSSMTQADLNMVMWMAQYASTNPDTSATKCYLLGNTVVSNIDNADLIFDFDIYSQFSAFMATGPHSPIYSFTNV